MVKASISTVLDKAAQLVARPNRWVKGRYARRESDWEDRDRGSSVPEEDGSYCAVGAIQQAASQFRLPSNQVKRYAERVLKRRFDPKFGIIEFWNDDHRRTQADVVELLCGAACEARKAGK